MNRARSRSVTAAAAGSLLLLGLLGGCRDEPRGGASPTRPNADAAVRAGAGQRPHVLLVSIDTLRADHTSLYGYPIKTTPVLEWLAKDGLMLRNMYAASATTGPSHAALFSSRHPRAVGYLTNGHVLRDEFLTITEVLSDAGYQTAAFVSTLPVRSRFGFGQGFDHYDQEDSTRPRNRRYRRDADETVDALARWLAARSDPRPLFVWLHLFDPHAPYRPRIRIPGAKWPEGTRKAIRNYDGEIYFADQQIGRAVRLLRRLSGQQRLLVAVTADHGEGLGDHGWQGHGVNLHEEAVRVPLVISWPGHLSRAESQAPAMLIDVAPTILSLAGLPIPAQFVGRVLTEEIEPDRPVFMQRRLYRSGREGRRRIRGEMVAIVRNRFKYIRAPQENRFELYDLTADPGETRNLADARKVESAKLDRLVRKWMEENPLPPFEQPEISKEDREALRALGYVD